MRWQAPPDSGRDPDYDQLYLDNLDARFDNTRLLQQASAQSLVAALVRRGKFAKFDPQLVLSDLEKHRSRWRSFIFGPPLPEPDVDLEFCLESLSYLPQDWGGNCLYLWAWNMEEALLLQSLRHPWCCDEVSVFTVVKAVDCSVLLMPHRSSCMSGSTLGEVSLDYTFLPRSIAHRSKRLFDPYC